MSKILKTLLATMLFAQVAFAQDANQQANGTVKKTATLSLGEMRSQAQGYKVEVTAGVAQIQQMVDAAQEKRDILKLNCLNDKLTRANASLKVIETASGELDSATAADAADHQYSKVTIANQQMQLVLAEANECVGEEIGTVGNQQNSTEVAKTVRTDQVTNPTPPVIAGNVKQGEKSTNPDNNSATMRPPIPSPSL